MNTASPRPVPVPANIEVDARLAGPFTARQCVILATTAAIALAEGEALRAVLHLSPVVVVAAVAPLVFAGCLLALVKPGGVSADRLLCAAVRHVRTGRRQADALPHVALPAGIARLAPLYQQIDELDGAGVVEFGGQQVAVVIEAQPRCLQLADPDEARGVLIAIGTVLAAQSGPFSISTMTERVSLDKHAHFVAETAERLATPQLADIARRQAEHLRDLAGGREVWHRRHLIALREAGAGGAARAAHRARATAALFESCGIKARVLDPQELTALLAAACTPERCLVPRRLAAPGRPVTARLEVQGVFGFQEQQMNALLSPAGIHIRPRSVEIDGVHATTLAVAGYPAEVLPGWLEALSAYPARLDLALHAEPVPPQTAAEKLRRRRTSLEAGRRDSAGRGRIEDPQVESAAQDAAELAGRIARAETKLFTAALYLTCYADSAEDLARLVGDVKALLSASLTAVQTPTFRMLEAWQATLPAGPDRIGQVRILDTAALAACAPLTSPDACAETVSSSAVLAGLSAVTGAPVFRDRWAQTNHNSLIIGTSGVGKSYLAKTDLIRELCTGTVVSVIDPEGEYVALAEAVGGRVVELGVPGGALNVLELPHPDAAGPCELVTRILDLHTLCALLLGPERAERLRPALDRAAMNAYRAAGISEDTSTWTRPAPEFAAVAQQAAAGYDPAAAELAALLGPYATGSYAALFNGAQPESVGEAPLTVYTLRHLPDALRLAGMLLVLSRVWNRARRGERRRMLLIDEVWQLLAEPEAARFVLRFAKSARKYRLGLSLATQDVGDLLASDLGTAVACNAATQILLAQAPQALARVTDAFDLTAGERDFLATAPRGYALERTRTGRTALAVIASPDEEPFLHTGI